MGIFWTSKHWKQTQAVLKSLAAQILPNIGNDYQPEQTFYNRVFSDICFARTLNGRNMKVLLELMDPKWSNLFSK